MCCVFGYVVLCAFACLFVFVYRVFLRSCVIVCDCVFMDVWVRVSVLKGVGLRGFRGSVLQVFWRSGFRGSGFQIALDGSK